MNKTVPLAAPTQRLPGTSLRTRSERLCARSSPRGGIAGRMYPGNFEFDALKKTSVKVVQQARYRPGEFRAYSTPGDCRRSFAIFDNIGVHGRRAKSAIGR